MKFELQYNCGDWIAEFAVIDLPKAAAACRESLAFFGDPITLDDESDRETIIGWLKFAGRTIALASMEFGSVESKFENLEGFFPLDGSCGIKLTDCWHFDIRDSDFEVEEIMEKGAA